MSGDYRRPPAVIDPEALAALAGKPCVDPEAVQRDTRRPSASIGEDGRLHVNVPASRSAHTDSFRTLSPEQLVATAEAVARDLASRSHDPAESGQLLAIADACIGRLEARALAQAIEAVARQLAPNMLEDRDRQLLLELAESPTVRAALALELTSSANRDGLDMPQRVQAAIAEAVGVERRRVRTVNISPREDGSTWISALVAAPPEVEP